MPSSSLGSSMDDGLSILCRVVETELAFRAAIVEFSPHLILSDFSLPQFRRPVGASGLRVDRTPHVALHFRFRNDRRRARDQCAQERGVRLCAEGQPAAPRPGHPIRGALKSAEISRARDLAETKLRRSESRSSGYHQHVGPLGLGMRPRCIASSTLSLGINASWAPPHERDSASKCRLLPRLRPTCAAAGGRPEEDNDCASAFDLSCAADSGPPWAPYIS